jgi:hypothetical protein
MASVFKVKYLSSRLLHAGFAQMIFYPDDGGDTFLQ